MPQHIDTKKNAICYVRFIHKECIDILRKKIEREEHSVTLKNHIDCT